MSNFLKVGAAGAAMLLPASVAAQTAPTGQADVYVLAGQSNMLGRGLLSELTETERVPDPLILLYGNDGQLHPALDPLDGAQGQVDAVSADKQAAVGPGLPFARAVVGTRRRPVVLVPCAKGGVSIGQWAPGGGRDTLYGSCLARVREAGGHLAGLLWYQGESDAQKAPDSARHWRAAFTALAARFRRDLHSPRLPIVFVQIADPPELDAARYPSWRLIQDQQAHTSLACGRMVSAKGLARNPDALHLTTASQRILGTRMAEATRALTRDGCS